MIYLSMYNENQKYSSCVCLDDKPEKDKKKHMKVGNYQNPQLNYLQKALLPQTTQGFSDLSEVGAKDLLYLGKEAF